MQRNAPCVTNTEFLRTAMAQQLKMPFKLNQMGDQVEPVMNKRLVQQGKRVTIRDRADIVCLVRRTYGNLFDYETDDAGTSGLGHAEPACPNVDMGNPGSSYRR